jgi:hypothetical protein
MGQTYYVFAAKGIQEYILKGDTLKFMTGGSEIVDSLAADMLDKALKSAGIGKEKREILSVAAGSARIIFNDGEDAKKIAERLPLLVSNYAPGLDVVQYYCEIKEGEKLGNVIRMAEGELAKRRNIQHPEYPVAGPHVLRTARSGKPLVGKDGDIGLDAAMMEKLKKSDNKGIEKKFNRNVPFETDFDKLKGDASSYIAVVHIDGNGLGKIVNEKLEELNKMDFETAKKSYMTFSKSIDDAAKGAFVKVLGIQGIKIRPLICAGDDVTYVVNPENAVESASIFLDEFERLAADKKLTAAAGIAFVKKSYPFINAYELCESLCRYAKNHAGRDISSIAFYRLTNTMSEKYDDIVKRELTLPGSVKLTRMPYKNEEYKYLRELVKAVREMPRGGLRTMLTTVYTSMAMYVEEYKRVGSITEEKSGNKVKVLEEAARKLDDKGVSVKEYVPPPGILHDAIELISVEGKGENE